MTTDDPTKRKVLYVSCGHPDFSSGPAETAAYCAYTAMHASEAYEPFLLFHCAAPQTAAFGSLISQYGDDCRCYTLNTEHTRYDTFWHTAFPAHLGTVPFHLVAYKEFLQQLAPDVVHIHHYLRIGIEVLSLTRTVLPHATIIVTLHDYLAMCAADGYMVKRSNRDLCWGADFTRCAACIQGRQPWEFFLREKIVTANFDCVDRFIAPSAFLRRRYVEWGIPAHKITVLENTPRPHPAPARPRAAEAPFTAGFFGPISEYAGLDILLLAAQDYLQLRRREQLPDLRIEVYGETEHLSESFRGWLEQLKAPVHEIVRFHPASRFREVPHALSQIDCVVVPSLCWENSPRIVQEAFAAEKPVICSDLGGLAEKVSPGVNGLHCTTGNHLALLQCMLQLARSPELYARLVNGIAVPAPATESTTLLERLYAGAATSHLEIHP